MPLGSCTCKLGNLAMKHRVDAVQDIGGVRQSQAGTCVGEKVKRIGCNYALKSR